MPNKQYIERLQMVIWHLYKCEAHHLESVFVHEKLEGKTIWEGMVEIFTLSDCPKGQLCYAWNHEGDSGEQIATVLGIPPVKTAQDAVRAYIASEVKKKA